MAFSLKIGSVLNFSTMQTENPSIESHNADLALIAQMAQRNEIDADHFIQNSHVLEELARDNENRSMRKSNILSLIPSAEMAQELDEIAQKSKEFLVLSSIEYYRRRMRLVAAAEQEMAA
jgi:hypothetical protein